MAVVCFCHFYFAKIRKKGEREKRKDKKLFHEKKTVSFLLLSFPFFVTLRTKKHKQSIKTEEKHYGIFD